MLLLVVLSAHLQNPVPDLALSIGYAPLEFQPAADGAQQGLLHVDVILNPDAETPSTKAAIRETVQTSRVSRLEIHERADAWVATWLSEGKRRLQRWPHAEPMYCSVTAPEAPGAAEWAEALCGEVRPMRRETEGYAVGSGYGVPLFAGLAHQREMGGLQEFNFSGSVMIHPAREGDPESREELLSTAIFPQNEVRYEALADGWIVMTERNGEYAVVSRRQLGGRSVLCGDSFLRSQAHARFTWELCVSLAPASAPTPG